MVTLHSKGSFIKGIDYDNNPNYWGETYPNPSKSCMQLQIDDNTSYSESSDLSDCADESFENLYFTKTSSERKNDKEYEYEGNYGDKTSSNSNFDNDNAILSNNTEFENKKEEDEKSDSYQIIENSLSDTSLLY